MYILLSVIISYQVKLSVSWLQRLPMAYSFPYHFIINKIKMLNKKLLSAIETAQRSQLDSL